MSGPSMVTELSPSGRQKHRLVGSTLLWDYWALTKPEVNFLILITTGVGFCLGYGNEGRPFSFISLFNTLLGTLLVASGTGALPQPDASNRLQYWPLGLHWPGLVAPISPQLSTCLRACSRFSRCLPIY